jgi:hypothetical protein
MFYLFILKVTAFCESQADVRVLLPAVLCGTDTPTHFSFAAYLRQLGAIQTPLLGVSPTAEGLAILLLAFYVSCWHLFAGLRSLAGTHNDGLCILYFMRVKEWGLKFSNANKGKELKPNIVLKVQVKN